MSEPGARDSGQQNVMGSVAHCPMARNSSNKLAVIDTPYREAKMEIEE